MAQSGEGGWDIDPDVNTNDIVPSEPPEIDRARPRSRSEVLPLCRTVKKCVPTYSRCRWDVSV